MECPSCGNVLSQDKNKKIECEYCGASVLPIRLETQNKEFQHTAESNFSEDLSEVRRLFEKSRYSDAREILIKLMEKDKTNTMKNHMYICIRMRLIILKSSDLLLWKKLKKQKCLI